jgi:hypothetical protein
MTESVFTDVLAWTVCEGSTWPLLLAGRGGALRAAGSCGQLAGRDRVWTFGLALRDASDHGVDPLDGAAGSSGGHRRTGRTHTDEHRFSAWCPRWMLDLLQADLLSTEMGHDFSAFARRREWLRPRLVFCHRAPVQVPFADVDRLVLPRPEPELVACGPAGCVQPATADFRALHEGLAGRPPVTHVPPPGRDAHVRYRWLVGHHAAFAVWRLQVRSLTGLVECSAPSVDDGGDSQARYMPRPELTRTWMVWVTPQARIKDLARVAPAHLAQLERDGVDPRAARRRRGHRRPAWPVRRHQGRSATRHPAHAAERRRRCAHPVHRRDQPLARTRSRPHRECHVGIIATARETPPTANQARTISSTSLNHSHHERHKRSSASSTTPACGTFSPHRDAD